MMGRRTVIEGGSKMMDSIKTVWVSAEVNEKALKAKLSPYNPKW